MKKIKAWAVVDETPQHEEPLNMTGRVEVYLTKKEARRMKCRAEKIIKVTITEGWNETN